MYRSQKGWEVTKKLYQNLVAAPWPELAAMLLTAAVAVAQDQQQPQPPQQQQQKIDHVTAEDEIVLDSGDAYETQSPTAENWEEGDAVTVQDGQIVNHDQDNDAADVTPTVEDDD